MQHIKNQQKSTKISYFAKNYRLYLMLLPVIAYLIIFSYYPMSGLIISFKDWRINGGIWGSPWATSDGSLDLFKHFKVLFNDPMFIQKFLNTIRISTLKLLIGFPVPIIITILLNEMSSLKLSKTFQVVSYLPYFISWVIISGILINMTSAGSAFQGVMTSFFGKELYFFTDNNLFLSMVVMSDIWKGAGWATIIYFAAITNIGSELYEAADIDGASRFQKIIYITLPGMLPAISIMLILQVSGLIYGGFDQIFNMYNRTVFEKGDILETYLFRIGINDGQYDVATAVGLFNSLIAFVLIIFANKIIKKVGGEGIW